MARRHPDRWSFRVLAGAIYVLALVGVLAFSEDAVVRVCGIAIVVAIGWGTARGVRDEVRTDEHGVHVAYGHERASFAWEEVEAFEVDPAGPPRARVVLRSRERHQLHPLEPSLSVTRGRAWTEAAVRELEAERQGRPAAPRIQPPLRRRRPA